MMSRKKAIRLIVGVALLVGAGVLFRGCLPPSQRSLVRNFERHRGSFEKVRVMLEEDRATIRGVASHGVQGLHGGGSSFPEDAGLSTERYREYRKLLKRVGATSVARRPDETRFLVARCGFGSHGWGVAMVHRTTEPNDVIASLREFRPDGTSSDMNEAYCPIADGWYIWIAW
jgi:hypothetical protein